jgi:hypothetical protein
MKIQGPFLVVLDEWATREAPDMKASAESTEATAATIAPKRRVALELALELEGADDDLDWGVVSCMTNTMLQLEGSSYSYW